MRPDRQKKSVKRQAPATSGDFQAEDAAAISRYFRQGPTRSQPARKAYQLCRQVAETLNAILSGECHDDVLQSLYVESVSPAPDATQLLVNVQILDRMNTVAPAELLRRLRNASGWFRSEIAAAITRRKAPHLVFQIDPRPVTDNCESELEDRS